MQTTKWINVRDKLCFLATLMKLLASSDSKIYLEGDLRNCQFDNLKKCAVSKDILIDKNSDLVCLVLTHEAVKPILRQIQPNGRFVHEILHIYIEVKENLQVLIGDNFHNECISVGELVTDEVLEAMKASKIIRKYQSQEEIDAEYGR